jgi:hypothetical protein
VDPSGHDAFEDFLDDSRNSMPGYWDGGNGDGDGGNPPPDLPLWKQGELAQQYVNSDPFTISTTEDSIQDALNGVGLIPGFGEGFDAINVMISFYRGDYIGAGLSAAAIIPFAG